MTNDQNSRPLLDWENALLSRRDVLRMGLGSVVAGGLLSAAACGGSGTSSGATTAAGPVKRGGTLTVGFSGGGSTDTLDPHAWVSLVDGARVYQLYNSLLAFDHNAQPVLSLADEFTPNSDATEWTIRLKSGVTFHDGKPLTADDVMYTFKRIADPKNPQAGATSLAAVDLNAIRKLDKLTLRVPCKTPFVALREVQACYEFGIVPEGFDPKAPNGTGPFKYRSFTPGQTSTFAKNENYWESGLPYVDTLVITDYADEVAQVNALQSGQADAVALLSAGSLNSLSSAGASPLISNGGSFQPFTMQVTKPPFNDQRVRQAFRLMVDRQQMLDLVFGGHGTIGNDLFAIWDAAYDHSLPQREHDPDQARALLKQAGQEGLSVELITSDFASGLVRAAQVFAQQATAAGVKVNVRQVTATELYGPNYTQWPFAQDAWSYYPYLSDALQGMIPGAPFNECGIDDAAYTKLLNQALAEVDDTKRAEIVHEMQNREYSAQSSGYIIPFFPATIDGLAARVHGLVPTKTGLPLSNYGLKSAWLGS